MLHMFTEGVLKKEQSLFCVLFAVYTFLFPYQQVLLEFGKTHSQSTIVFLISLVDLLNRCQCGERGSPKQQDE